MKRLCLFLLIVFRVWNEQETMFGHYGRITIRIGLLEAWRIAGIFHPWSIC
jgi:hypothetical protein